MDQCVRHVRQRRIEKDSFFFNWSLDIPLKFQQPFIPTHEAMASLDLHHGRKPLEQDLRRALPASLPVASSSGGLDELLIRASG